jgi:bifunctional non-homologous end joining protein LigD
LAQIDGELCLCDARGRPDFRGLLRAAALKPADETGLSFHAFDLLQLNTADLKPKPLVERRKRLVDLVQRLGEAVPVLYLPNQFSDGTELLTMCGRMHLEGIVSKRLDRPYVSGPIRDWVKIKCTAWKEARSWRGEAFADEIDNTRYKTWRSGHDPELHVIVYEARSCRSASRV